MSGRLARRRVRPATRGVAARGELGGDRTLKAAGGGGCARLGHLPGRVVGGGGGGRGVGFQFGRGVVHFHLPSMLLKCQVGFNT